MNPVSRAGATPSTEGRPGVRDVLAQLAGILESPLFSRSKGRTRFLSLVVNRTLEGAESELKEYQIGIEALGRQRSFDPRLDPAVRVHATHVRSRLAEYYAGPGSADPVRIELPPGGYVPVFSWNVPAELPDASIAVLPCMPLDAGERAESFADGITEELINALAQEPGIKVVARTSAWVFKGKVVDVREIGALLKVRTVLESTLRTDGERLRISARLSDTKTGYTLWSQNFDSRCDDALEVQEELAAAIVAALKPRLDTRGNRAHSTRRLNPGEYETWTIAKFHLNKHTNTDYLKAIEGFQKVIDMDPGFVPAYTGLAEAWFRLGVWGGVRPAEAAARTESVLHRALELDPNYGLAHAYMGAVQALDLSRMKDAGPSFEKAMRLAPGSAQARNAYAVTFLTRICRFDEAEKVMKEAQALDPLSLLIGVNLATIYYCAGNYRAAEAQARKVIDRDPTFFRGWFTLGRALSLQGRHQEALTALARAVELTREGTFHVETRSVHAVALRRAGKKSAARAEVDDLFKQGLPTVGLFWLSLALAWIGDMEESFRILRRAADEKDPWVPLIVAEPMAAPIRADVRYRTFLDDFGQNR